MAALMLCVKSHWAGTTFGRWCIWPLCALLHALNNILQCWFDFQSMNNLLGIAEGLESFNMVPFGRVTGMYRHYNACITVNWAFTCGLVVPNYFRLCIRGRRISRSKNAHISVNIWSYEKFKSTEYSGSVWNLQICSQTDDKETTVRLRFLVWDIRPNCQVHSREREGGRSKRRKTAWRKRAKKVLIPT